MKFLKKFLAIGLLLFVPISFVHAVKANNVIGQCEMKTPRIKRRLKLKISRTPKNPKLILLEKRKDRFLKINKIMEIKERSNSINALIKKVRAIKLCKPMNSLVPKTSKVLDVLMIEEEYNNGDIDINECDMSDCENVLVPFREREDTESSSECDEGNKKEDIAMDSVQLKK